jgi:hypothetical protein
MEREFDPIKQQKMTKAAATAIKSRTNTRLAKLNITRKQWHVLYTRVQCAYQRCSNPNNREYKNYGQRGIRFNFETPTKAVENLIEELGPPPDSYYEIDRANNEGHYEPGNIRYATRKQQANNKRLYKRGATGERIRQIQTYRPDYHYESIRYLIKKGLSDTQIIAKKRHKHVTTDV